MLDRPGLAFALSGFAALACETAWSRALRLALGGTSEAHACVLALFMGGLAIGSAGGGRVADRRAPRDALRLYASCEVGVGALALAGMAALNAAPLAGIIGAALLVMPPCALMGATLPLLARACTGLGEDGAHAIGRLYALNTAGAVAGALATGFVLMGWPGVSGTLGIAALANFAAAGIAYGAARDGGRDPKPAREAAPERTPAPLLAAAALSGAAALGLEVLWDRTLVLVVGSSTHAFALMLATFLAGIALGSAAYAHFGRNAREPARLAALLMMGVAASSVLLLHLAGQLPYFYVSLWASLHGSAVGLLALRLVPAVALMLVPAVLSGASLPALARAASRDGGIGRELGAVYAANTAGGIAGAALTALVALPALGVARASTVVAGTSALGALAALRSVGPIPRAAAALLVATAAVVVWAPAWEPAVMGKGLAYTAANAERFRRAGQLEQATTSSRVVYYHDGAESSVLVYDGGDGTDRQFVVNGRHEATSAAADMRNQYLLGHLPALLHRGPVTHGLVIALGSGMTAGCLALHAEHVTVVELERGVIAAARTFAAWNHGAVDDPRVHVVIDDGRHHLLANDQQYDVITVDPIHPSVAGSDALYSLEQYQLVQRRLAPGGVAAQWLPLYEMGVEDARAIARTFREAFPDAQIWVAGSDAILIGGAGAGPLPIAPLRDGLAQPAVAESLARVHAARLGTFVAALALAAPGVERYTAGAPVLRDDRPALELSLPWKMYDRTTDANLLEIYRFSRPHPALDETGLTAAERSELRRSAQAVSADQIGLALSAARHEDSMLEFFRLAIEADPDDAIARDVLGK